MSKPTMILLAILLLAAAAMMFAADLVIGPVREDIAVARELIAEFDNLGWLVADRPRPDNRIRVRTLKGGGATRLSKRDVWGVIIEVRPALETLTVKDRLGSLTRVITDRIEKQGLNRRPEWIELAVIYEDQEILRTLIEWAPPGGWQPATPPVPETWRSSAAAPR